MPDAPFLTALPVSDMFPDREYQREIDEKRTRRIARDWDPRLVGVLDVADRQTPTADGRYAIINGQHRWSAAILVDPTMQLVCNVHQGLTVADEARLFWDIDRSTKHLTTWDRWKARLAAGEPSVVRIDQLCRGLGAPVAENGPYVIKSTSTLEQLLRFDEYVMTSTIQLIIDVWPGDSTGLQGGILRGLFPVVGWCYEQPESGRLADALSGITPAQIHARAVGRRETHRTGQFWTCVTRVIVDLYNANQPRANRLPIEDILNLRSGQ